ncbi:hypothetical protein Mgra_00008277 [Meloidogyne graminicola]|uniref:Probable pectate lyase F n=1 Tax=Meloidogyne graminicola TaxID=189291 RepID=A0A8S9ZGI6_9BILA|nr:hypothetical protein Mgra_00008277 [Meloidogyne graminicola]
MVHYLLIIQLMFLVFVIFIIKRIYGTKNLCSKCDIQSTKNAKNIIEIEDGGTIKNVIIDNGGKGVWCKGSCTLINVYFKTICYHAVDFGNSLDSTNKIFNVNGGAAMNAPDKIFTQSGAGKTFIKNFCAEKFGKCWRSCGMECYQYKRSVSIINSKFQGPFLSLISLNKNFGDEMFINNIKINGYKTANYRGFGCQEYFGIKGKGKMVPAAECPPDKDCHLKSCNFKGICNFYVIKIIKRI